MHFKHQTLGWETNGLQFFYIEVIRILDMVARRLSAGTELYKEGPPNTTVFTFNEGKKNKNKNARRL